MLSNTILLIGGLARQNTGGAVGCVLGVIILPRFLHTFHQWKSMSPEAYAKASAAACGLSVNRSYCTTTDRPIGHQRQIHEPQQKKSPETHTDHLDDNELYTQPNKAMARMCFTNAHKPDY